MTSTKQRVIHGDDSDLFNAVSIFASSLLDDNVPKQIVNIKKCEFRNRDEDEDEDEEAEQDKLYGINIKKILTEGYDYTFTYNDVEFKIKVVNLSTTPIKISHYIYSILRNIIITTEASDEIIDNFIRDSNKYYKENVLNLNLKKKNQIVIRIWSDEFWNVLDTCNMRQLDTVYLMKETKSFIIEKITNFLQNKKIYDYLGIIYKLNLLFEGPPGCGKTTTIKAIASYINYDVNILTFDLNTTDTTFINAVKRIKSKSILVLEDIDCLFVERKSNDSNKNMITFSSLLNVLDGFASKDGLIVIMTSNYKNNLDEALIRPGRIDSIVHFDYIKKEQLKEMFLKFVYCSENMNKLKTTPDETRDALFEQFYKKFTKLNMDISCSLIQQYLFQYVDKPDEVVDNITNIKKIHQQTQKEKTNMYM